MIGHISLLKTSDDPKKQGNDFKQNRIHCEDSKGTFTFDEESVFHSLVLPDLFYKGGLSLSFDMDGTLMNIHPDLQKVLDMTQEEVMQQGTNKHLHLNNPEYINAEQLTDLGRAVASLCNSPFFISKSCINTARRIDEGNDSFRGKIGSIFGSIKFMNQIKKITGTDSQRCTVKGQQKAVRASSHFESRPVVHFDDNQGECEGIQNTEHDVWPVCVTAEHTVLPKFKKQPFVVAIEGPVGSGKSTLVKELVAGFNQLNLSVATLNTDDNCPNLIGKKHNYLLALGDKDVIIFDSTGNGQVYPKGTHIVSLNGNQEHQALHLLQSVYFTGMRGLTHGSIMGCDLSLDDIQQLLDGKFIYNGEFAEKSFLELLNNYSLDFVITHMTANGYVVKQSHSGTVLVLGYRDKQQKFNSKWGVEDGRGNCFVFHEGKWEHLKMGLPASKDNGITGYGRGNMVQEFVHLLTHNAAFEEFKDQVKFEIQSKKDGLCMSVVVVPAHLRQFVSQMLAAHPVERDFYEASGQRFFMCTRGGYLFENEYKVVKEAIDATYGPVDSPHEYELQRFIDSCLEFYNGYIYSSLPEERGTWLFEFVPKTNRQELACQGPAGITFLGYKDEDGYHSSSIFSQNTWKFYFPVPHTWNLTLNQVDDFMSMFTEVSLGRQDIQEFLERYAPVNHPLNTGDPSMISFEGFIALTTAMMMWKLKVQVYYDIHKMFHHIGSLPMTLEMLLQIFKLPKGQLEKWLCQFTNLKPISERYSQLENEDLESLVRYITNNNERLNELLVSQVRGSKKLKNGESSQLANLLLGSLFRNSSLLMLLDGIKKKSSSNKHLHKLSIVEINRVVKEIVHLLNYHLSTGVDIKLLGPQLGKNQSLAKEHLDTHRDRVFSYLSGKYVILSLMIHVCEQICQDTIQRFALVDQ